MYLGHERRGLGREVTYTHDPATCRHEVVDRRDSSRSISRTFCKQCGTFIDKSNTGSPCSSYTIIATGVGDVRPTSLHGESGSSTVLAMASLRWSCKTMSSTLSSSWIAWSTRSLNAPRIATPLVCLTLRPRLRPLARGQEL